jgi:hypothetical protein
MDVEVMLVDRVKVPLYLLPYLEITTRESKHTRSPNPTPPQLNSVLIPNLRRGM